MKKPITAKELFDFLTRVQNLVLKKGVIKFTLDGVTVESESKDIVGGALESWTKRLLQINNFAYERPTCSQDFPDFYLSPPSKTSGLLEVKSFDYDASANFDVANFDTYTRFLKTESYRLDADYLIIAYSMNGAEITIRDIWLKKVWEITGPSEAHPVKVQAKQHVIYNIRPIKWFDSGRARYTAFRTRLELVTALHQTLVQYRPGEFTSWLEEIKSDYRKHTGNNL